MLRRWLLPLLLAAFACSQGEASDSQAALEGDSQTALAKRGEHVFQTNCTACHARNPAEPGPVGPPVAGASLALLEAKVLRNEYPPGYTPQRDTKAMIPLAHLAPELPALAVYLAQAAGAQ